MTRDARIYLVEDDHAIVIALVSLLSLEGFAPAHFRTADEFLAGVDTLTPASVLFNIRLPGTDGLDAARQLRALGLDWPIVLVTGDIDIDLKKAAREIGASYLEKPFSGESLLAAIGAAEQVRCPENSAPNVMRLHPE